jgi:hypothetical protein
MKTQRVLPPSSSLPAWPKLSNYDERAIFSLLQGLSDIYCPLAFQLNPDTSKHCQTTSSQLVDSGYASGIEDDEIREDTPVWDIDELRNDAFERNVSERWLTTFMARADSLPCLDSDDKCQRALDQASQIIEAIHSRAAQPDAVSYEEEQIYTRDFSFQLSRHSMDQEEPRSVKVQLNDGLAGKNSDDPDDVGLQSWGASIVMSALLCELPARFGLTKDVLGHSPNPQIIELGAGTGLISIVLAQMLPLVGITHPKIFATDYHQVVLANLRSNIARNFPNTDSLPIETSFLDWAEPPSDLKADMLIATDVVYAWEHAVKLRKCAAALLKPEAIFWLVATVRPNGGFEGLIRTVEAAFSFEDAPRDDQGRRLCIVRSEHLDKVQGVGRGDESGYKVFQIGWV